jgi:hypothetical protein
VRTARAVTLERLKTRLDEATTKARSGFDRRPCTRALRADRQNGMSILARDGASRAELEAVAELAMLGWDARTAQAPAGGT